MYNSTFFNNTASIGGAIALSRCGALSLEGCRFTQNTAEYPATDLLRGEDPFPKGQAGAMWVSRNVSGKQSPFFLYTSCEC
jgi:hypothetical protein